MNRNEYIEKEVAKKSQEMELDAHSRSTLRSMLGREYDQHERYEAREEEGHSHSAVGDWNGARE